MSGTLNCAYCGRVESYPDGYANRSEAMCWQCLWDRHMQAEHPLPRRVVRRISRRAGRAVARRAVTEATREHNEQALLFVLLDTMRRPASEDTGRPLEGQA